MNTVRLLLAQPRWRRLAGLGLLALIGMSGFSLLSRRRSIEAYVTADVLTIRSPIDGVVVQSSQPAGALVAANTLLIQLDGSRSDAQQLADRRSALLQRESELAATQQALDLLNQTLRERLDFALQQANLDRVALEAKERHRRQQHQLYRQLVQRGALALERQLEVEAELAVIAAQLQQQRNELRDLELQQRRLMADPALAEPSALIGSTRFKAMDAERSALLTRKAELQDHRVDLIRQVQEAETRQSFLYQPKFASLVLTNPFNVNDEVTKNSALLTLVNCSKLRIEALFDSNKIGSLSLGQLVSVRWHRDNITSQGRVTSMRGEQGIGGLDPGGHARFKKISIDQTRLTISLPEDLPMTDQCRFGERVQVDL